ncbi:MAG: lipocalin-like domain-containing protein [Streptosporangiaceae bacterium]
MAQSGTARFGTHRRRWLLALTALAVAFAPVPSPAAVQAAPAAKPKPRISLPKDESPHDVKNEWWYFTGHLSGRDAKGVKHSYGYELTFFRHGLGLFPRASTYWAHFAVTDLNRRTFEYDSRTTVQADVLPGKGGYDIRLLGWHLAGRNGKSKISASSKQAGFGLSLDLRSLVPAALHGKGGIIPFGAMGSSSYYSQTRVKTSGTIVDHGRKIKVTGQSWFDHQWGDFTPTVAGWDWFSVQLSNHTEYMVYVFRDSLGKAVHAIGTVVRANGTTVAIPRRRMGLKRLGTWTSPATRHTYASGWRLRVPGGHLIITPRLRDQELASSLGKYWEGACAVRGVINGEQVRGLGYTELLPPYPQT